MSPSGNDFNPGTEASPKRTIQAGINAAGEDADVLIAPGFYNETATLNRDVDLVVNGASDVTVTGLILNTGDATSDADRAAIVSNSTGDLIARTLTVASGYYILDSPSNLLLDSGAVLTWSAGTATDDERFTTADGNTPQRLAVVSGGTYSLVFANTSANLVMNANQLPATNPTNVAFNNVGRTTTTAAGDLGTIAGNLTVASGATAVLTDAASVTGTLTNAGTINNSTLTVAGATTNSGTIGGTSTLNANGALTNSGTIAATATVNAAHNVTNNGTIAGELNLTGGTVSTPRTLSGGGTFTGQVEVISGERKTSSSITLGQTSLLLLTGGNLDLRDGSVTLRGNLTFGPGTVQTDSDGRLIFTGDAAQVVDLGGANRTIGNATVNKGPINFLEVQDGGATELAVTNLNFEAGRIRLNDNIDLNVGSGALQGIIVAADGSASILIVSNATPGEDDATTVTGTGQILVPIVKQGAGIVILSVTEAADVEAAAGTLRFTSPVDVAEVTASGGTVEFNAAATADDITASSGSVEFNASGNTVGDITTTGGTVVFAAAADEGVRTSAVEGTITTAAQTQVVVEGVNEDDFHILTIDGAIAGSGITVENFAGLRVTGDLTVSGVDFQGNNRLAFVGTVEQEITGGVTVDVLEFANPAGVVIDANFTAADELLLTSGTVSAPNGIATDPVITVTGATVVRSGGSLQVDDTDSADPVTLSGTADVLRFANTAAVTTGGELAAVGPTTGLELTGTGAVTLSASVTTNDLLIEEGATLSAASGRVVTVAGAGTGDNTPLTVNGAFTGAGAIALNATGNASITGAGSVSNLDVTTGANTVTLAGPLAIADLDATASAGGTFSIAADADISDLLLAGSGAVVVTANGPAEIMGPLTINGPTVTLNRTLTVEGNLALTSGIVQFGVGEFELIVEGPSVTINPATADIVFDSASRLVLAGDQSQVLTLQADAVIERLEIDNPAGVSIGGPFALFTQDLILTEGPFTTFDRLQANVGGQGRVTVVNGQIVGSFAEGAGPLELVFAGDTSIGAGNTFSGAVQDVTISVADTATVTLTQAATIEGVLVLESGTLNAGDSLLTIAEGAQVVFAGGTLAGQAIFEDDVTARFVAGRNITTAFPEGAAFTQLVITGDSTVTLGGDVTADEIIVSSGTLDLGSSTVTTSGDVTVNGSLIASDGGRVMLVGSSDATVGGSYTSLPGIVVAKEAANDGTFGVVTITRTGTDADVTITGDFVVSSGIAVFDDTNISGLTVEGAFDVQAGAHRVDLMGLELEVGGDFQAAAAAEENGTDAPGLQNLAEVTLNGESLQTLSSNQDFTSGLVIDNAAGVTLLSDVDANTLALTAGVVTTGENTLTVTTGQPGALTGSGSVVGTLARRFADAGTYRFPLRAENGNIRRVDIVNNGAFTGASQGTLAIEHDASAPQGQSGLPVTISGVEVDNLAPFSWSASLVSGTPIAGEDLRVQAFGGGLGGITDVGGLRLVARAGEDETLNPWQPFGQYVTSLFSGGVPTVVHSGIGGFDIVATQQFTIGGDADVNAFLADMFEATLAGINEVQPVDTDATGQVTANLNNNQLVLSGSFSGLSSKLRAAGAAGSSAHIHSAPAGENGGISIHLVVNPDADSLGGTFEAASNTFTLTQAQIDALAAGGLYVNVHTQNHPGGEIRGQLLVAPNAAPEAVAITSPANGAAISVGGEEGGDPVDPATSFTVSWDTSSDPNGDRVVYVYQLATDAAFENVVASVNAGTNVSMDMAFGDVVGLLDAAGVDLFGEVTVYHRVVATDGSRASVGAASSVTLQRGTIVSTDPGTELPTEFALHGNYPNPFNPATRIQFDLPQSANVRVEVVDVLGRQVLTVDSQSMEAGANRSIAIDASHLASGQYLYRIVAEMGQQTKIATGQMILVK